MTGLRTRLKDRRAHWLFRFECDGQSYTGGIGRFADGRIAEVFINATKVGTAAETTLRTRQSSRPWPSNTAAPLKQSGTPWQGHADLLVRWRPC
ncbi:hypothetical protein IVB40_32510 [Bradyrhizobium sp. 40]|uniref:hypothetical protein n=1 Tax=Bradyrhizobium sp. 40 TaxID=2782674 RepID=UPI001FFE8191|nr:hypothetical protein [Bradyrhizobium sp. 40]UPJ41948.1 hypothetical protein IVB40_32510 [Bradyrhizobium sp. 40]